MHTSPITVLLLAVAVGVAGAVAVVIFHSVVADAVGGALGLAALAVVIRSAIQLAGEAPSDDTASQHLSQAVAVCGSQRKWRAAKTA